MYCEICDKEVELNELHSCPGCGHYFVTENTAWEVIYESGVEYEAEIMKAFLLDNNIPCELISQIDSTRLIPLGKTAIVRIYVPKELLEKSKLLIRQIQNDFDEVE